ncbi:MAG: GntR family transcriptional regulator [Planctomycetota bacterium]
MAEYPKLMNGTSVSEEDLLRAEAKARRVGIAVHGARGWAVRWIGGQIKAGRWGPGDVLPGERGLAKTIGVSRETLRGALDRLERAGLIVRCGTDGRRRRFAEKPSPPANGGGRRR